MHIVQLFKGTEYSRKTNICIYSFTNSNAVKIFDILNGMVALKQVTNFLALFCKVSVLFSFYSSETGNFTFQLKYFQFARTNWRKLYSGVDSYCNHSYVIDTGCVSQYWSFVFDGQRELLDCAESMLNFISFRF